MDSDTPVIIEVAVNGEVGQDRNPNSPRNPEEIAEVSIACLDAGATVVHTHIESMGIPGREAIDRYAEAWEPIRRAHPGAILYPTFIPSGPCKGRFDYFRDLAADGLSDFLPLDPGATNFAVTTRDDGLPGEDVVSSTGYGEIRTGFALMAELGLGPTMAMMDPSYVRAVIAWHRAGKLPAGAFLKFYFGGTHDQMTGRPGVGFGLLPTATALDAYLEMFEGVDLPWAVAVVGGDVIATGMARHSVERGGHIRVGLEDYAGPGRPTNVEMVKAAVDICRAVGRPVATCVQARRILGLRSAALVG